MSTLKESLLVEVPFAQAPEFIERFFVGSTLRLAAPGAGVGIEGFALAHDVEATFRRHPGPNFSVVFDVHWESADGGPYPVFDGQLIVAADETYESCRLTLEGSYTPPGKVAGAAFDAVLGSKIASATAKELLARVRTFMREGYEKVESSKRLKLG